MGMTASQVLRERELEIERGIGKSLVDFDLGKELTEEELKQAGLLLVLPGTKEPREPRSEMPLLQEIEDTVEATIDAVEGLTDRNSYNVQYVRYLKCQAIATLLAFTEGWSALEELALKPFIQQAKRENEEYRGDDPNKAFRLRVKQQTAEDFFKFIKGVAAEAVNTPKPSLAK